MQSMDFACTACGRCCRDMLIPLALDEVPGWIDRGGEVALLPEMVPWTETPSVATPPGIIAWLKERTFPALCGKIEVRIRAYVAAVITGPCHHLEDTLCTIHGDRPLMCRSYPVETNDPVGFYPLDRQQKDCPPEAWQGEPIMRGGRLVEERDEVVAARALQNREVTDLDRMRAFIVAQGLTVASTAEFGSVIIPLDAETARVATQTTPMAPQKTPRWRLYSPEPASHGRLKRKGFHLARDRDLPADAMIRPR